MNYSMGKADVTVVILTHNNTNMCDKCLGHIRRGSLQPAEIIVLNNGSEKQYMPTGARNIQHSENIGCIMGRNMGAKKAQSKYILFLDDDQLVTANSISELYNIIVGANLDMVGSELKETNSRGIGHTITKESDSPRLYLGGGGLIVKRSVWESLGGLDEMYAPAYCSDSDFFWRAIEAGHSWGWAIDADIEHLGQSTMHNQKTWNHDEVYARSHALLRRRWAKRLLGEVGHVNKTAILILTHNRHDIFKRCFENALLKSTSDIYLLDNGSTDPEAIKYIDSIADTRVTKCRVEKNIYCAPGRAYLVEKIIESGKYADYDYFLFLDDDIEIKTKKYDAALCKTFKESNADAVHGLVVGEDGIAQDGPSEFMFASDTFKRVFHRKRRYSGVSQFGPGGLIAYKADVLRSIYKYMELYPAGYADIDAAFRMKVSDKIIWFDVGLVGIHFKKWNSGSNENEAAEWRTTENRVKSILRFRTIWGMTDQYIFGLFAEHNHALVEASGVSLRDLFQIGFRNSSEVLK